ncbi:uncharacterized protein KY384_007457 [Bacidia gigantensis]|uniref:uncharacterized protein n=1 Tax=Bacidia gigantensis TaxID=2732470 RepID=UPI001D03CBA2|nr:uncharacterized protein KY384_007457 [Bacidia gigantensis]KAG8528539.1 hypothetical protein KY384_007457 [Bacidia gigantensis]
MASQARSSSMRQCGDYDSARNRYYGVIFTQLIDRIKARDDEAKQTLILVHRRELVEQAARHCATAYPWKTIEVEMGKSHGSGVADITIASVQTMISKNRMLKYNHRDFKLVLVDEAHHIVSASYMDVLKHFHLSKDNLSDTSPSLVGVSATMSRFDGLRLSDAIDHIVYHKDYVDMIEDKWLSDVIFTTVQSKVDLSGVKNAPSGDFQVGDLAKAVNTPEANETTVRAWKARAFGRKSTLGFCVDLAHVADLTSTFRCHGYDARFVTGDTPKSVRSQRLDAFKSGEFPVLLNCGVFTEGTDIPNIDCILLARPTKSRNLLIQMIGRGMRLHPEKQNCHIVDMVASLEAGIVTTPTLFGLDPHALVEAATVEQMKTAQERKTAEQVRELRIDDRTPLEPDRMTRRTLTFTDYDCVYDLISDTSGDYHIRGISQLAWVMVGPTRYILSAQDGSYVTLERKTEQEDLNFGVIYTQRMPEHYKEIHNTKSPFLRPREIAKSVSFSDAVHAADTFASQKFAWKFIGRNQPWRRLPATDSQLAFLNKLRPQHDPLTAESLTKGKATDMISKMKFGAKGWYGEMKAKEKRKLEKARHVDNLREREQVRVGPIAK